MKVRLGAALLLLWLVVSVGCASSQQAQEEAQAKADRVEAILTQAPDDGEYAAAERCLSAHQYRSIRILDDRHIVFEGRRGQHWLNTLPMRCPGLRPGSTVATETRTNINSLCKLDSIAVYDWMDIGWHRRWPWPWGSGPKCALGEFQPITDLQLEAIKAALRPPKD